MRLVGIYPTRKADGIAGPWRTWMVAESNELWIGARNVGEGGMLSGMLTIVTVESAREDYGCVVPARQVKP